REFEHAPLVDDRHPRPLAARMRQTQGPPRFAARPGDLERGARAYAETGHTLPPGTLERLAEMDGWILGPLGHAAYRHDDPKAVNPHPIIRRRFDLYANIRPSRSIAGVPAVHESVDLVIVRENNEDMQPDRNMHRGGGECMPTPEVALSTRVITRRGSERIARAAFEIARARGETRRALGLAHPCGERPRVSIIHKRSVFKLTCGLFVDTVLEMARDFPEIDVDDFHVDSFAMALAMKPQRFDTIVVTNMFGDILSDLAAGVVGGLGLAPGLNTGDTYAMAQATHGSAPDIAGRNIANPYAIIMSAQMLLAWLGRKHSDPAALAAADKIERAVHATIGRDRIRTPDIGGGATTDAFGRAVIARLRQED
ncbi:MAG TPA: isocitrate/isopropylmalate family dehydrogenase, partial [Candidatus Eisenbacteria bacterium]|nr:isocitrate/isopropylmalate family dehydrogenase [Candidatus Eisenbacteria bacterium]